MVADAGKSAKPGQWIYGRGWHQEKWTSKPEPNVEGFPAQHSLDKVSPNNPVLLTHASGHASFANAKAMELSKVTGQTPNPQGGEFLKDAQGNPTGLVPRDRVAADPRRHRRAADRTADEEEARAARGSSSSRRRKCWRKGMTTFQDAGSSTSDVDRMKRMMDEGKIDVRLWVMLRMNNQALAASLAKYRMIDYGNGLLTVRAHQEVDRRRARSARCLAARAVLRQAGRHRAQHDQD